MIDVSDGRMHLPTTTKEFRQMVCAGILKTCAVPTIEPVFADYEYDNGKSAFIVRDSFAGTYEVTIKKVA